MGGNCDKKGDLKRVDMFPRVLGYKRGSDIMEVKGCIFKRLQI